MGVQMEVETEAGEGSAQVTEEIPVLDLGPFLAGEAGAAERLAGELRYAQENIGFYFVVNHGVPMDLIRRGYAELERVFALPEEEKLKLRATDTRPGYVPPNSTVYVTSPVNKNTKGDLNEVLRYVNERTPDHPGRQAGRRFHGPNPWPENLPGFKETIKECHHALASLGRRMLPLYALALDKPADFFEPFFDDPLWTTRNSHYPVMEAEENQYGISPHQDHGFDSLWLARSHVQQRHATRTTAHALELLNIEVIKQGKDIAGGLPMGKDAARIRRATVTPEVRNDQSVLGEAQGN